MSTNNKKKQKFSQHYHATQPQSFAEVLDSDTRPVPEHIKSFFNRDDGPFEDVSGPCKVPTRWYTDHDIYKSEKENIWKKRWQVACRVEHVLEVGDTYVYEIAGMSFIIVRADETTYKGYWNSCLHRGLPLRECSGYSGGRFQCPFHGFTWDLHGKNIMIPHPDQFPDIDPEEFSLPEVQVEVWKGFIFINPDLEAGSLESHMGAVYDSKYVWPYELELAVNVSKVFSGNWKTLQEAFMESYHVLTTHPQTVAHGAADRCTEFIASGDSSMGISPMGYSNEYLNRTPDEQEILKKMGEFWDDEELPESHILPEGMTARQFAAEGMRHGLSNDFPGIHEKSDTEMMDVYYWTVFPNFHPFGMHLLGMCYIFRPHKNDPDKSVMELMLFKQRPEKEAPKAAPEKIELGEDEEFSSVKALGTFGTFISQDSDNMNSIIQGLRNSQIGYVNLAHKYEGKIRHFYSVYEKAMGLSAEDEIADLKKIIKRQ